MEPVDYLKILRNHWKVVAALVLLAVVAAFFAAPRQASQAYTANHVLLLESSGDIGSTSSGNVSVAALWTTTGDVPLRAAARLYPDEDLEDLADEAGDLVGQVEAVGDIELNLVTITATASERDRAIAIANAFGAALIDFIDDQERQRREEAAEAASAQAAELEARIGEINAQLSQQPPPPDAPILQGELARIEAQLASAYDTVEGAGGNVRYVTMSDAITASREGSLMPNRSQAVLLTAFVAALLGFGVAIVLDRNDSRLRTKEQVERQFGLPVLAEVPLLGWRERSKAAVIGFRHDPRVAEAHRGLRTGLLLFGGTASAAGSAQANGNGHSGPGNGTQEHHRQLVVITSAESGEGKTTTVANLAMAHAETGQSVLVVNWDLWRPMSLSAFGAAEGPGVVDYLDDQDASLARLVQDTSVPSVRIVTAGVRSHHPAARIETVQRLLEEARSLADVVIVDTAPILSASVSRELATFADAVVVVCRAGRTTGAAGGRVAELLERLGAPTLGVVLIGAPTFGGYYGSRSYLRRRPELDTSEHEDASTTDDQAGHPAPVSGDALSPPVTHYRADIPRAPEAGQAR